MPDQSRDVSPGPDKRSVRTAVGRLLRVPREWVLVKPGDPALTRRVKKAGPAWTMKEKRGRRTFSLGVWTDKATVDHITAELAKERAEPSYAQRLDAGRRRRDAAQAVYAEDFEAAVAAFLSFAPEYEELARALSVAITKHTVPVGAGTVARTKRIPLAQRAEAATIAWLRHRTTQYDDMHIPHVRGMRRKVRRLLAERSRELLHRYRAGEPVDATRCPLRAALARPAVSRSRSHRPSA
jgi:hypothetical protein